MAPKKAPKKQQRRTGGPKRSKRRFVGILGLPHTEYHSSEDEDYVLPQRASAGSMASAATAASGSTQATRPSRRRGTVAAAPTDAEGAASHSDADSSGSDVPLAELLQLRSGRASGTARARHHAPSSTAADWGQLPPDVLAKMFAMACRGNAVPAAAVLPCVCSTWRDVAAQVPQLWARVELGVLPPPKPHKAAAAEKALLDMVASGRWKQLAHLQVGGGSADGSNGGQSAANGRLLLAVSQHCSSLVSLHLDAIRNVHVDVLEPALLAMTALQELRLTAVVLKPLGGLDKLLKSIMGAAVEAECGLRAGPRLHTLAVVSCPLLSTAGVKAFCPAPPEQKLPAPADGAAAMPDNAQGPAHANAAAAPAAAGAAAAVLAAAPLAPVHALASLCRLDLSFSARAMVVLPLEQLQEAAPGLEELRLSGLGSAYGGACAGWMPVSSRRATVGFPRLQVLDVAAPIVTTGSAQHGSAHSYVGNALLARIAGASPLLQELDISGTYVTRAGLAELPSPPLVRLQASRCADVASDDGLAEVARLFGGTLRELEARGAGSRISDAALHSLGQCQSLELLDISGSGVTAEGITGLLRSLAAGSLSLLELESCRGLDRNVRRAATAGLPQLRRLLLH